MATEQMRDATSHILAMTLKQHQWILVEVHMYLQKPVKHQHAFHDLQMLLQILYGAVTASRFGQYVIVSFWTFYDRIYTVGCDGIKITMATQQVRDATSLI